MISSSNHAISPSFADIKTYLEALPYARQNTDVADALTLYKTAQELKTQITTLWQTVYGPGQGRSSAETHTKIGNLTQQLAKDVKELRTRLINIHHDNENVINHRDQVVTHLMNTLFEFKDYIIASNNTLEWEPSSKANSPDRRPAEVDTSLPPRQRTVKEEVASLGALHMSDPLRKKLYDRLINDGFNTHKVLGDGDCALRAVYGRTITRDRSRDRVLERDFLLEKRRQMVNYIKKRWSRYQNRVVDANGTPYVSKEAYERAMSQQGAHLSGGELFALSKLTGRTIKIYSAAIPREAAGQLVPSEEYQPKGDPEGIIHLYFNQRTAPGSRGDSLGSHYDLLVPRRP